jgi:maltose alpha-D-glucosyltransferase/alpha-amylase
VNWVRNHDELDLEQLGEEDRQAVMDRFAPDDDMRIYGRGIRRRTAPMLGGDPALISLAHALAAMLPGSPVLLYGDEIGMGDDLSRPERFSVRTPMQWDDGPAAGFSASADDVVVPVIDAGPHGYEHVNVAAQNAPPDSLLNRLRGILRARLQLDELGAGTREVLDVGTDAVLALCSGEEDSRVLLLANLSADETVVRLPAGLVPADRSVRDVVSDRAYEPVPGGRHAVEVPLAGHGYRWLR